MALEGEVEFDEQVELAGAFDADFVEEDYRAIGMIPESPTGAKPGSEQKVLMLAARYAAGLPLWHSSDCYDHGPGGMGDAAEDEELIFATADDGEEEEE